MGSRVRPRARQLGPVLAHDREVVHQRADVRGESGPLLEQREPIE